MTEENKPKRGGRREGAGRKLKDHVETAHVSMRVRKDWLEIIAGNSPDRSTWIQEAIREKLERGGLI